MTCLIKWDTTLSVTELGTVVFRVERKGRVTKGQVRRKWVRLGYIGLV